MLWARALEPLETLQQPLTLGSGHVDGVTPSLLPLSAAPPTAPGGPCLPEPLSAEVIAGRSPGSGPDSAIYSHRQAWPQSRTSWRHCPWGLGPGGSRGPAGGGWAALDSWA